MYVYLFIRSCLPILFILEGSTVGAYLLSDRTNSPTQHHYSHGGIRVFCFSNFSLRDLTISRPTLRAAFRNLERAFARRPAVPPLFAHFPGAAAVEQTVGELAMDGEARSADRGEDGLSPVVIHRRLVLCAHRPLIDGRTRERHGGRVHANTCYEQQVRTSSPPFRSLYLFPPRFHSASPPDRDVASVWQDWQVARSFVRSVLFGSVV